MLIKIPKNKFAWACCSVVFLLGILLLIYKYNASQTETNPQPDNMAVVGEYLTWNDVKGAFPKEAAATIIDFDSRLSFRVQRRGGYNHVDVQPLTAADSAVMKKIYNDHWSWKRKAVVVQLDNGRMIAASMNGMPHGQGAISGNNFDGHFCIHFRDSKTHGSGRVDLAHQLMIWKAANILDQQLALLKPQEIVAVFISALDQNDMKIAAKLIDSVDNIEPLLRHLEGIRDIKADKINRVEDHKFKVELRIIYKGTNHEIRKSIVINTVTTEPFGKIESQSLTDLLYGNTRVELESSNVTTSEEDWD